MNVAVQALEVLRGAVDTRDLIAFLFRLTLVVALGRLLLAAAPRASAATRHLVATVTLLVALLMPLATAVLPAWRLPLLPSAPVAERSETNAIPITAANTAFSRDASLTTTPARPTTVAARPDSRSILHRLLALPAPSIAGPLALVLLVLGISQLLLLRIVYALVAAAIFTRRARAVGDPRLLRAFDRARDRIGLRRPVALKITERVSVPVVSGLMRPALLLPLEAEGWDSERLEIVFLHELAHVQRFDLAGLVLAKATAAAYWFHPFVWALHRDARRECERACDDQVLKSGVRASDYAETLLVIARRAASVEPAPGAVLAIAGRSNLERRLRSILSTGVRRERPSARVTAVASLLALVVLLPVATLRVTAAPARPAPAPRPAAERAPATTATPEERAPRSTSTISGSEWYARARRFYERERYAAAAHAYERAARGGHQTAKALYNAACSYALDDQPDEALSLLEQAVEAGWDDIGMIKSDDDLDSIRDDPRFDRILERARSIDPDEAKQTTARAEFEALRSSGSTDADEWGDLGRSLLNTDDPELAAQAFEKQIALESNSTAIYNLACAQARSRETAAALATLERAILAGYGDVHHMRNDDDLASLRRERRFAELTHLAEDLDLDFNLLDNGSDRWRRELPRYEETARTYPQAGRAWFNLGFAQLRVRENAPARASFQRALDLQYRPKTTMYNLACASAQLRDLDEAMRWLTRAEDAGMRIEDHARFDRDLFPLRSDPRFRALLRRLEKRDRDDLGSKIKRILD